MPDFLRELRKQRYDLILDFQGLMKSALVARAARGDRRIGPSYEREGARLLYSETAGTRNKNRHAVEEALDFARHLGLSLPASPMELSTPAQPANRQLLRFPEPHVTAGHPRIAVMPCSRWITKNWPVERFAEVCLKLQEQRQASFYIFGAREDREPCAVIARALGFAADNLCGQTDLPLMGGYLAKMDLALCVDSGPMHMAAALGTPVVAVFGSTDPLRTGPYGAQHRIVTLPGLSCRPCRSRECLRPEKDTACLTQLPVDAVADACLAALA
jgi:lipopolysaccharide heptosyltransferase II